VQPLESDVLNYITVLIILALALFGLLLVPGGVVLFVVFDQLFVLQALRTECAELNMLIAVVLWYILTSGLADFAAFTCYGLMYSLAVSKWLNHIRYTYIVAVFLLV